jgi:signal transduction histidine kinase
VLGPLYLYGSLAVLFMPISALILRPWLHIDELVVVGLQLIAIGPVPVLFALAVFKGGFARTAEIEELGAWLGTVGDLRPELTYALARTLGDPSIQLAFWVPQRDTYVDWSGAALALPASGSGRHAVEIELRAKRVGAIVYDATLIGDPDLVRKAGRVVAIAVDHERLTAELKASEEALRQSRARIAEAGYRERRRFAQDLHDGLQVRLVLLALEAQEIAGDPMATTETRHAATMLRAGIDSAASELRQLVHNVMPAPLVAHGLSAATEDLVDRMPVPTSLSLGVEDGELPKNIESTAYFVVAEALANAVKHAQAKKLDVNVAFADGQLLVRVSDDGIGGATPGNGAGLRGIADRVDVLGGTFSIDSPSGGGTVLVVALPYQ